MLNSLLERLLNNLQETHKVYTRLLEVAERKQNHILNHETENLKADLKVEEGLAGAGTGLNAEREEMHGRCRAMLNLREGGNTLEELCRFLPHQWRQRFLVERQDLRKTLERLHSVNRMNVALVNHSLELMEGLLSALFDAEPVCAYGPDGIRTRADWARRALDARV